MNAEIRYKMWKKIPSQRPKEPRSITVTLNGHPELVKEFLEKLKELGYDSS